MKTVVSKKFTEPSLNSEGKRPTIKRTLTEEALKEHDLFVSKYVDSTSERELIYDEEQRVRIEIEICLVLMYVNVKKWS